MQRRLATAVQDELKRPVTTLARLRDVSRCCGDCDFVKNRLAVRGVDYRQESRIRNRRIAPVARLGGVTVATAQVALIAEVQRQAFRLEAFGRETVPLGNRLGGASRSSASGPLLFRTATSTTARSNATACPGAYNTVRSPASRRNTGKSGAILTAARCKPETSIGMIPTISRQALAPVRGCRFSNRGLASAG